MSAQTIMEAFAPAEAQHRENVLRETWGHLAPKRNKVYKGRIVYSIGCYDRTPQPLFCEFSGLDDSPWFFDAMTEFIFGQDNEAGCIYEFVGIFRNFEFRGQVKKVADYTTSATRREAGPVA